ncbi:hypothetical protein IHE45_06G033300 [Dioscorea alata]|uniref:Uncharacterized protein n=1 Tax=Dioscorea alata TaxID=55571 RepID=A0ACB7VWP9_DIOAL|nr:hypothetical protein IHE45_06G033300 [Dioscorea alata]
MSNPYYDWYMTNTIIFLSSDQDFLDPRRRGNVLPTPLQAFPIADVDAPPPSTRPPRRRRCGSLRVSSDEPTLHEQQHEAYQPPPSSVDIAISQSSHYPGIPVFDHSRYSMDPGIDFMQTLFEYEPHVSMERGESSRPRHVAHDDW